MELKLGRVFVLKRGLDLRRKIQWDPFNSIQHGHEDDGRTTGSSYEDIYIFINPKIWLYSTFHENCFVCIVLTINIGLMWYIHPFSAWLFLCYLYHLVYLGTVAVEVKQPWAMWLQLTITLQWRHNGRDSVSNHQPHDCLLNCLFKRRLKKPSKPRVSGLWEGNSPGTGEFSAQMASNAENVSIWWRHHDST